MIQWRLFMKSKRFISLSILSALSVGLFAGAVATKKAHDSVYVPTFATYTNGDAETYYDSISSSLTGNDLLKALRDLNLSRRKSTVGYSAMGTSPSGQFKYTDYDPNYVQYDSNGQPYGTRISSFYTYTSATSWNREHVWPNSHGGGSGGNAGSPYPDADIHMPRPTISSENSSRGNSFFVEGMNHSSNGWDPYTAGYSAESRGEAARITFYCLTVNSKLALSTTNTPPSGTDPVTGNTYSSGNTMGNLETLLKWTINYPVNQREKNRNEGAEYLQGNRNAFVDHPEYACRIWGNVNDTTRSLCQNASWEIPETHPVTIKLFSNGAPEQGTTTSYTMHKDDTVQFVGFVDGVYSNQVQFTLLDSNGQQANSDVASIEQFTSGNYNGVTVTANQAGSVSLQASYYFVNDKNQTIIEKSSVKIIVKSQGGGGDITEATLLTDPSDVEEGDLVIAKTENGLGITGFNGNKDATASEDESAWVEYEVKKPTADGFKLYDSKADMCIAAPTANEFKYSETGGVCTVDSDGHLKCGGRYLCKNGTYYRFYGSIGQYEPFYLYRLPSEPEIPVEDRIEVVNPVTEYVVGDTFVTPRVLVHYTNEDAFDPVDVTSSCTFSGFDSSSEGACTITVTYKTFTATYNISVIKLVEPVDVESVSLGITDNRLELEVNEIYQFNATVLPTDATNKEVTWTLQYYTEEDQGCAQISETGLFTALRKGYVMVYVHTVEGGYSDYCIVRITDGERPQPKPAKKGCGGSVIATSVVLSVLSLSGLALVAIKKKKEK